MEEVKESIKPHYRKVRRFGKVMWECSVRSTLDGVVMHKVIRADPVKAGLDVLSRVAQSLFLKLLERNDEVRKLHDLIEKDAAELDRLRNKQTSLNKQLSDSVGREWALRKELKEAQKEVEVAKAFTGIAERRLGVATDIAEQRRQEILRQDEYIQRMENTIKAAGIYFRFESRETVD